MTLRQTFKQSLGAVALAATLFACKDPLVEKEHCIARVRDNIACIRLDGEVVSSKTRSPDITVALKNGEQVCGGMKGPKVTISIERLGSDSVYRRVEFLGAQDRSTIVIPACNLIYGTDNPR